MKRIFLAGLCFTALVGARADVIEFQNGAQTECQVLSLIDQRLEYANKDGSITHIDFGQVKSIAFASKTAMLTTCGHVTLNGRLLHYSNDTFVLSSASGIYDYIRTSDVSELTVSSDRPALPAKPKPPLVVKPPPVSAADFRKPARGSIEPERDKITIVDFYADWCGPCRKMSALLKRLTETNSDVVLQKVNIDQQKDLAAEYKVTAIPHIIVYDKSTRVVDNFIGLNEARLRKAIADATDSR